MDLSQTNVSPEVDERVKALPVEIIELITDGVVEMGVLDIKEKYNLTAQQSALIENEIVLTLLMFFSLDSFLERITESLTLNIRTAEQINKEVYENIFSLVDDIILLITEAQKEANTKNKELTALTKTFEQGAQTEKGTEPPLTKDLEKVEPIRTMSKDADRVHGYGVHNNNADKNKDVVQALSQEETFAQTAKDPVSSKDSRVDAASPK